MPHRLEAVETARALAVSGSGTIAAVAMGLSEQLNVPHEFLNLYLPYWVFLLSMMMLNFVGAGFATQTDYMKANGSSVGNFFTAVFVGFFLSFVVLPTADPDASVGLMQIASFISGLCGTILLRVIINIMNRQDLQDAIVDLIVQQLIKFAGLVVKMVSEHAIKLIGALLIGIIASLAILPDSDSDNSQQQAEVRND